MCLPSPEKATDRNSVDSHSAKASVFLTFIVIKSYIDTSARRSDRSPTNKYLKDPGRTINVSIMGRAAILAYLLSSDAGDLRALSRR